MAKNCDATWYLYEPFLTIAVRLLPVNLLNLKNTNNYNSKTEEIPIIFEIETSHF